MKEIWVVWDNTRMVVFTAICAALYAAILIPFKVFPLIPGITELRPANAIPVVCSFLFGPAAAWGAAIGNVIGDFFGGIGPGDFFGFVGNFLYGLVPYKVWETVSTQAPVPKNVGLWLRFLFTLFVASAACALVVGWGLNLLGFVPFAVLGNIVLFNNFVSSVLFAPLLLAVLYPRVARGRLLYIHLLERPQAKPRLMRLSGLVLLTAASVGGLVVGNLLSAGRWTPGLFVEFGLTTQTRAAEVGVGLFPFVVLACVGVMLL
ncbi:MAG: QueT transporter family protein [Candidatus Binatia bacterium]|nr:QueT transporter family protein [Candidatus Binatia bacterium]